MSLDRDDMIKPLRVGSGVIAIMMITLGVLVTDGSFGEPATVSALADKMTMDTIVVPSAVPSIKLESITEHNSADNTVAPVTEDPWTVTVLPGQTLDGLLRDASFTPRARAAIASALAAEYDARQIRPGHQLNVEFGAGNLPSALSLTVDDGVRIDITLGETPIVNTVAPTTRRVDEANQFTINGTLYGSLSQAGVPVGFAVEIARLLRQTIDLRRDLRGGELMRVLWSRQELEDGSQIGSPRLHYAALDAAGTRLEIVWSQKDSDLTLLYVDGQISQTFLVPASGGRLSSAFGPRKHPVYGDMRLHSGVDYAASLGAPVVSTAAGTVSFSGWRSGYGRVVEISHGRGIMTRYAHLNAVTKSLSLGDHVSMGTVIGEVGQTGTTTNPNLHYEVRVADQAVDPLGVSGLPANAQVQNTAIELAKRKSLFNETLSVSEAEPFAEGS